MTDDDPDAVEILLKHLYGFRYPWRTQHSVRRDVSAYILAAKYVLPALAEEARASASVGLQCENFWPDKDAVVVLFKSTSADDPHGRFVVEEFAQRMRCFLDSSPREDDLRELIGACPQFMIEVCKHQLKLDDKK